jgi:hypothetical protein
MLHVAENHKDFIVKVTVAQVFAEIQSHSRIFGVRAR